MQRYREICSICLQAATLILAGAMVAQAVDIGGTTYTANTTLNNGDTWTSGNVTINGVTVTVPNAATVTYNAPVAGNARLYGTGTSTARSLSIPVARSKWPPRVPTTTSRFPAP